LGRIDDLGLAARPAGRSSIRKVCLSGAPAHFISVAGRVKSPCPPFLGEAAGRLPGPRGVVGPGVKRADAVLAHHVEREALDRVVIENRPVATTRKS
jgi:hypothetical protein